MYSSERPAGDTWLLVGDAASFIDPLSSAGVKKAMASGWLAAVALNTALAEPAPQGHGLRLLFAAREAETYAPVPGADPAAPARRRPAPDHPFWADRAAALPPEATTGPPCRRRSIGCARPRP